jgi:hypothetical protein
MKLTPVIVVLSSVYLCGCVSTHATSRVDSAEVLSPAQLAADNAARKTAVQGETASAWGDWNTSVLLFKKAVDANTTPLNKFNLATAYQRIGQNGQALITYDAVIKEGAGVRVKGLPDRTAPDERTRIYDLADESKARVATLVAVLRTAPTAATSDEEEAALTPQQAAALDAQANPL